MRIAFYAPMKAPTHVIPSGDRHIARLLWRALESKNHTVELVSDVRAWEGDGDLDRQESIKQQAESGAMKFLNRINDKSTPDIWFTYHVYHKAPDWIGPRVSQALRIPYVVAEISYAAKQVNGPWTTGLEQTRRCIELADAIINLNNDDVEGIEHVLSNHEHLHWLKPFIDVAEIYTHLQTQTSKHDITLYDDLNPNKIWLVTVAMMRLGDKLASFKLLADAMQQVGDKDCQLIVVGDGMARSEVEQAFASSPVGSVYFLGQLEHSVLLPLLTKCELFVWPAVNEAYGMAMLEAQACGLPVVAGASGGVSSIIDNHVTGTLTKPGDTLEFAQAIRDLIDNPMKVKEMSTAAKTNVVMHHSLESAANRLDEILLQLT